MTGWSTLAVLVAVVVGALAKGITGVGLPMVAVPVIAAFVGVEHAVVVMAIPGVVSNAWLLGRYRREAAATRDLPLLVTTGVIGVALGTWLLTWTNETVLSLVLVAALAVYLVIYFGRPGFALSPGLTRFLSPVIGLAGGAMQGATGVSGPLFATYVHAFRLRQRPYVLSLAAIFLGLATVQVAAVALAGLYTPTRVVQSLLALVPVLVVLPFGIWLSRRLDRRTFDLVVLGILALTGVKLLFDATTGG